MQRRSFFRPVPFFPTTSSEADRIYACGDCASYGHLFGVYKTDPRSRKSDAGL